jgi:predicted lysophospholipase L1 biosynthesis ABC-type transport system permease subunit
VGAALGYWLLSGSLSHATFGWVFGLIAGVMVFLALDELLPAKRYAKGHETVYGLVAGMGTLAISLVLFNGDPANGLSPRGRSAVSGQPGVRGHGAWLAPVQGAMRGARGRRV